MSDKIKDKVLHIILEKSIYSMMKIDMHDVNIHTFDCCHCQKLNPSIEATTTRIIDQIRNALEFDGNESVLTVGFKIDKETSEEKMMLKINSQLAGMPFIWHFIGHPAEGQQVSFN